ncbi:MAG: EamA family transporter [Salinivirgaceae bacterium]|jgi:undecaprenyl phosphate-alpha-L-ara4N flippase subunit ArnF|nr:EamA family transporter [Salinivirgaceae bacterium]
MCLYNAFNGGSVEVTVNGQILNSLNLINMGYLYILGTLFFTIYGQMILKWRLNILHFELPKGKVVVMILSFFNLLIDPYILSGFVSAFIASVFWIFAMTKFEITFAYPFMSIAPALVFALGILLLGETFTWGKIIGLIFIMIGILVTVKF